MDHRLNLALLESQQSELRRRATAAQRVWPDDGRPPRVSHQRRARKFALHPTAVLGELLARH